MIRIVIFSIVLGLTGGPVMGMVCDLSCEAHTAQHHHQASPCHETSGASVTGLQGCTHDLASAPAVLTAGKAGSTSLISQPTDADASAVPVVYAAADSSHSLIFPPGASPGSRSSTTPLALRI